MNEPKNDAGNDPYTPPGSDFSLSSQDAHLEQTYEPKIFSMHGRIGRLRYMVFPTLVIWAYLLVAGIIVGIFAALVGLSSEKSTGAIIALVFLALLLYVPIIGIAFVFAKRRLHDLNQSGWLGLLLLVPILGAFFALYMMFAPGSKGANQYGPAPSKNPTWIKVLTGVVLLVTILVIAVAIPQYAKMMDDFKARSESALPANSTSPDKADSLPVKELPAQAEPSAPAVGGEVPNSTEDNSGGGNPVEPTPQPKEN